MDIVCHRMTLRPYASIDWERLCIIHDAARMHELEASGLAAAFLTLEATAENEGLFDGEVIVAEFEGQVCGFVAYANGELTWLYVDPSKYKQGIGRQLLRNAIEASGGSMPSRPSAMSRPSAAAYLRRRSATFRFSAAGW